MSLLDRTNSISKESPSSLLPPEPKRPLFKREEEPLPTLGPSSLLPESPGERYPSQEPEQVVSVSPSSLLDTAPPTGLSRGWMIGGGALSLAVAVILFALAFSGNEKPTPQLMQEAIAFLNDGKHDAAAIQLKNVLAREPDNVDANLLIGKAYLGSGALLDAEKALRRARELGAPADEVLLLLARVLIDMDRPEGALKELAEATTTSVSGPRHALLRGRAHLGLGNLVEARTQFTVARAELPAEANSYLARVMMAEGNPEGASKLLDETIAQFPMGLDAWLARGDLLRMKGERAEALAAFRQAQSIQSDNLEAILGVAHLLISRDEFGEAQKELRKARAISPSSHLLAFASAVLAYREKRYEDCRDALQAVFTVAPRHMPSVLLAGALSFDTGDIEQAHDAFALYLTRFPGDVQARKMHAVTLLRKQRPEAVVESLAQFVNLDIQDGDLFTVAGQAYLQIGNVQRARELLGKAAALKPTDPGVLTDLGLANLSAGMTDAGIVEFEKAVALGPKDPRPDRQLALALIARNRLDDAFSVADRLEKRLPGRAEPHWLRGLVYALRNDAQASVSFERALKANPSFYPAAAALAQAAIKDGKPELARSRFEAVLKADPKSADAMLALAELDAAAGRVGDAIGLVRRALSEQPNVVRPHILLARYQLQAGNMDDALATARRAREVNPRDPAAAEVLGQLQLAAGDAASAVLSFTSLVNLRPKYVLGRIQLAQAQRAAGDRRTAIAVARDAWAVAPRSAEVQSLLGRLLTEDKAYQEALKVAERAREDHPKLALGNQLEGEIRLALKDPQAALAAFKRADEIERSGLVLMKMHQAESAILGKDAAVDPLVEWIKKAPADTSIKIYTADALVRLGRMREAVPLYKDALKVYPKDHRILNNLADALLRAGDPQALDYAQQAFQIQPSEPVVAATLGGALLRNGKLFDAVQVLQKAVQLDAENAEIRYQFVQALAKAGDRTRAKSELKALLATGKSFPEMAEARALLGQL